MTVAIDGPAGSGKSTIAQMVAERCGFFFINSGNFYRAITYKALNQGVSMQDHDALLQVAKGSDITIQHQRVFLDGVDVEDFLHSDEVDQWVAELSAIVPIRHRVNELLRAVAGSMDIVTEGRDVTTVVFPHAEVKIFMTASAESRAKRRFKQQETSLSLEEIMAGIEKRDKIDTTKAEGALYCCDTALFLDTTDLTIHQVCDKVVEQIKMAQRMQEIEDMSETTEKTEKKESIGSQLQDKYLEQLGDLEEGQFVSGTIIEVASDYVFVDIGYKSEGRIPLDEFQTKPNIGDQVEVLLVHKEGRLGQVVVSKKKADVKKFWNTIRDAQEENAPIEGVFKKVVKGGFSVEVAPDVMAFCPLSKADISRVENPESLLNKSGTFAIKKIQKEKNRTNIVLSRRDYLEEKRNTNLAKFFEEKQEGDTIEGEVKSFTSFGAFVDLGGFDGLLHINDMSWGHTVRPKDFVVRGQKITLKIIKIDQETKKINLSLKHMTPDPWEHFEAHYAVGDIVEGTVTKLTQFGAFVQLEAGIEGLAHISELSWVKRINHPKEVLKPGDRIEVKILDANAEEKKLSLGVKQVTSNPWDTLELKYPPGSAVIRKVVNITNAGLFLEIEDGIDAFCSSADLTWQRRGVKPDTVAKVGDELEVMVLSIDKESRRIRVGKKQLEENPWEVLQATARPGTPLEGEVTNITDFGIFVRVEGGIEGLVPMAHLKVPGEENTDEPTAKYSVGDKITAAVLDIDVMKERLSLSVRNLQNSAERAQMSEYLHDDTDEDTGTVTFGDLLKQSDEE